MNDVNKDGPLTDAHFTAFGKIVYLWASMDTGLKLCLAGIMKVPIHVAMIAAEPYGWRDLQNVSKSVAKLGLEASQAEGLSKIIGDFGAHSRLRNHIAHHRWTEGVREGSIQPVYMHIRKGRADPHGYRADETDYTLDDFEATIRSMARLNEQLVAFMSSTGLTDDLEAF